MAAAIKALNAKIRANPVADYFCSTHFWGPASNFGIPIAAVMDTTKDPEIISGPMTTALMGYSGTFMRYSMAVTPKNYLLFGCHIVNFCAQSTQGYRYLAYWNFGGREAKLMSGEGAATEGLEERKEVVGEKAGDLASEARGKANELAGEAKGKAMEVKGQVEKALK